MIIIMRYTKRKWRKLLSKGYTNMDYETWKRTNKFYENHPSDNTTMATFNI